MEKGSAKKTRSSRTPRQEVGVVFRRQFDPGYKPDPGQINKEKSKTVPDMSLSVKQLYINHTKGIMSNVHINNGVYTDDVEVPVYEDMLANLTRKMELKEELAQVNRDIKKQKEDAYQSEIDKAREEANLVKKKANTPLKTSEEDSQAPSKED